MRDDTDNIIVSKTFDFALKIIDFSEKLRLNHKYEMCSQLFKSGASIGTNVLEAQNAESNADFINKFKISAKEAYETNYWLKLCKASKHLPNPDEELFSRINLYYKDNFKDNKFI